MKRAHRPILVVGLVFAFVMGAVAMSRWLRPKEIVPWRTSFATAQAEAKASGRPMLVYFTADWCAPCHTLKTTTWADPKVEEALRAYVPTRVDVMVDTPTALKYGAEFLPKYVVLDGEGNIVRSMDGYLDPEAFLAWLAGAPRERGG